MAKKASKESKYVWAWVKSNTPGKPTDAEKAKATAAFAPWVEQQKRDMPPIKEPQESNQVVDLMTRWRGSYFYVMSYYKCPDRPEYVAEGFEYGVARLTYKSPGCYDVAYFRHTGQWWTFLHDLTLEQAFEEIKTNPLFVI
jgi:hypothetical protein